MRRYTGRYAADSDIEFRVTELDGGGLDLPGTPCRMLLRTTRAQLLQEFTHRLAAWLQHDYVADDWSRVDPDNCEDAAEFADVCRRVDLRQCLDMAGLLQRVPLKAR